MAEGTGILPGLPAESPYLPPLRARTPSASVDRDGALKSEAKPSAFCYIGVSRVNVMKIAIVTMVYNERVNLPIWIRPYSAHCPGAALFVIDHGSDDGSTQGLPGINLIPLPRTPFDDQTRTEFVTDFQHALLRFYDIVIYTDCDDMLVADP